MILQKSWKKWLNEGDMNSKYFHLVMKGSLRRNHICPLLTPGGLLN